MLDNIPVGIGTDRDLVVEVLAMDAPIDILTLADLMSPELATVREHEELWVVLNRMRSLGVRRMPVVRDKATLVGILTMDDAVELISEALSDMSHLVRREISEEVPAASTTPLTVRQALQNCCRSDSFLGHSDGFTRWGHQLGGHSLAHRAVDRVLHTRLFAD